MNNSTENILKDNNSYEMEVPETTERKQQYHTSIYKKLINNKELINKTFWFTIYGLLIAYFVWATVYFINNTDNSIYYSTCTGYGFLLIIFCLTLLGISYYLILKPHVIPKFSSNVWEPLTKKMNSIRYGSYIFFTVFFIASVIFLILDTEDNRTRLVPLSGLAVFLIFGFVCSKYPSKVNWKTVLWGLVLQFTFGLLTIRWEIGRNVFACFGDKVTIFLNYAVEGAAFVYGNILVKEYQIFAFNALSTVFFLSFMINIFYHYGIMQKFVSTLGSFLQWVMGTTVCESVNAASNIFMGQSDAPLLIKPYLADLTASEIHTVMTSGFATVAGTLLAAYVSFGASATHLITSSVMSAPAALCYSKLMYPETEESKSTKENIELVKIEYDSALDAASKGATDGISIVMGVISNLIAFISFIYFVNGVLSWMGMLVGYTDEDIQWSIELFASKIFIPISYIMGVPWVECEEVGKLIGIKTMVNEFAAFSAMQKMALTPRTKVIATYAICGFSNPGSIGIQISILSNLAPNKRNVILKVVFRAFLAGAIVCFMTACIAALLIPEDMTDI